MFIFTKIPRDFLRKQHVKLESKIIIKSEEILVLMVSNYCRNCYQKNQIFAVKSTSTSKFDEQ